MAKRQQRTTGGILEIDLGNGYYNYAQILDQDIVFFDIYVEEKLDNVNILVNKEPLFFLGVYDDVITKGRWLKIGKLPVRESFQSVPNKFTQDQLDPSKFELYITDTGEMKPATRDECEGLEYAAVWEADHVEDRLRDHYAGKENVWVQQLKIK